MRKSVVTEWLARSLVVLVALAPVAVAAADEEPVEEVEEQPAPRKIKHAAMGAGVTVSSTHTGEEGEGPASSLVDGDLTTRWSSDYSAPQEVTVDLGKLTALSRLRLHWERASALRYSVMASSDGQKWRNVHLLYMKTSGEPAARIDNINLKGVSTRFIRLVLRGSANPEWGFSLYEVEVIEGTAAPRAKVDKTEGGVKEQ